MGWACGWGMPFWWFIPPSRCPKLYITGWAIWGPSEWNESMPRGGWLVWGRPRNGMLILWLLGRPMLLRLNGMEKCLWDGARSLSWSVSSDCWWWVSSPGEPDSGSLTSVWWTSSLLKLRSRQTLLSPRTAAQEQTALKSKWRYQKQKKQCGQKNTKCSKQHFKQLLLTDPNFGR